MKKTEINPNAPAVENYPPLKAWLDKHDAVRVHQFQGGGVCASWAFGADLCVEIWRINGYPFVIQIYGHNRGWNILTSLDTNSIPDTLRDAEIRLGINNPEGRRYRWAVEIEVDETWVEDGFDLTDERATDIMAHTLRWARSDEFAARVLARPVDEAIAKAQGYKDVEQYRKQRTTRGGAK